MREDLIERLRNGSEINHAPLGKEAADALEAAEREVEDWKRKNALNCEAAVSYGNQLQQECQPALEAANDRIATLERENIRANEGNEETHARLEIAERENERLIAEWADKVSADHERIAALEQENDRLREALKFYSDGAHDMARAALSAGREE